MLSMVDESLQDTALFHFQKVAGRRSSVQYFVLTGESRGRYYPVW